MKRHTLYLELWTIRLYCQTNEKYRCLVSCLKLTCLPLIFFLYLIYFHFYSFLVELLFVCEINWIIPWKPSSVGGLLLNDVCFVILMRVLTLNILFLPFLLQECSQNFSNGWVKLCQQRALTRVQRMGGGG